MRQRGFGYLEIIIGLVIIAVIAGGIFAIYEKGVSVGEAKIKLEWEEANRVQREKEAAQIAAAAKELEAERAKRKVVYRTITQTVDKIVDRPVYRNVCMDPDGLQCVNAALRGEDAAGCKPDGPMRGIKPAGFGGRGSGNQEADRGGGGLQRMPVAPQSPG